MRRTPALLAKLVAAVLVAGTVTAVAGTLLIWNLARSALQAEVSQGSAALAEELAIRIDGRLEAVADTLRVTATRGALTQPPPAAADAVRATLAASASYDELVVYDADGRPVAAAATRFLATPEDYPPRPGLVAGVTVGPQLAVLDAFPPVLEAAVALERPAGTVVGALLARLPLETVAEPIHQGNPSSTAVRFLVDGDGRILVHPDRDRVAEEQRFPPATAGGLARPTVMDVDGVPSLVAIAPTRLLEGAVVLQQPEAEALTPATRQLRQMTAALLATMIAAVAAVSVAGSYLLRPLRPLADAVARLERGERGVSVDVRTADEIGQLARQFNQMAATLDRRRDEIEELHRLSLLLGSRADRGEVADDIARGATRLLAADASAFLSGDDDNPRPAVLSGSADGRAVRAVAQACAQERTAVTQRGAAGENLLAVPVAAGEEGGGVLVVARAGDAFSDEDVHLAEAFASFAGVALQTVRRLELERALVHELQEAVDRKRDLLTGISHELLTPLTCIESFSSRLLDERDPPRAAERARLAAEIHQQASELDELVTRLLDLVMTERGQRSANTSAVPLRTVVSSAVAALEPVLGDRPVDMDLPEVQVLADPVLLVRVLTNLLSNAVKYSPPGTPIAVRARQQDGAVRIDVVDQGIGIEPQAAARVFKPFWRGPQEPTRPGMGVGLALAADYVHVMHGTISVDSTPGEGSTFTVTVPYAPQT